MARSNEGHRQLSTWIPSVRGLTDRLGLDHGTFAVTCLCLGSTMLHTTFMFYYVKVFVNIYHISEVWFQAAQVLFMIWNAVNDPIFSMIQDSCTSSWVSDRRKVIYYAAPWFCLSFLVPWFPWTGSYSTESGDVAPSTPEWVVGVHLIVSLFVYDGMFSWMLLAHCSLFTESTVQHRLRVRTAQYMQGFVLCGLPCLFVVDKASSSLDNYQAFQIVNVVFALLAFFTFRYTAVYSDDAVAQTSMNQELLLESGEVKSSQPSTSDMTVQSMWLYSKQIIRNWDFVRLVCANFIHILHMYTLTNFAAIYTETLLTDYLPPGSWQISLFYSFCALFPQFLFVTVTSKLAVLFGPFNLLVGSCSISLLSGLVAYWLITEPGVFYILFLIIDSCMVYGFHPLMSILFPQVVDQDTLINKRKKPLTTMVYGLNALFTKPAQSVAAMMTIRRLNAFGYADYTAGKLNNSEAVQTLRTVMLEWGFMVAIVLGLLEIVAIAKYSMKHKHIDEKHIYEMELL